MPNDDRIRRGDANDGEPNLVVPELLSLRSRVRPDDIAEHYSDPGVALTLKLLRPAGQDSGRALLLIEGDKRSLLFLADLLLAQAADPLDCGFQLVKSDDSLFFTADSEYGLYIHALPCSDEGVK
jgi:hypothetical protein